MYKYGVTALICLVSVCAYAGGKKQNTLPLVLNHTITHPGESKRLGNFEFPSAPVVPAQTRLVFHHYVDNGNGALKKVNDTYKTPVTSPVKIHAKKISPRTQKGAGDLLGFIDSFR